MPQKCLFCLFVVFVELYFGIYSGLFPEHGYRATNLHMGETIVVDDDDLFGLTKVGHLSFGIQSSGIVSGTTFLEGSPGN